MADPVTMLILASGGLMAAGQVQEGRIAKAQGSLENKLALREQEALNRRAIATEEAGKIETDRIAREEKLAKGAARATTGKQGGGLGGSSLAALTDMAAQYSIQKNITLRNYFTESRNLRQQGKIMAVKGKWAKTLGKQTNKLAYVKAGATILASAYTAGAYQSSLSTGQLTDVGKATQLRY